MGYRYCKMLMLDIFDDEKEIFEPFSFYKEEIINDESKGKMQMHSILICTNQRCASFKFVS